MKVPLVCVIGEVNSGKTTFLEKLLEQKFIEYNNITQKIRILKYEKKTDKIMFIDTPGHCFFSFIIKRIINISDILIILMDVNKKIGKIIYEFINYSIKKKKPTIVVGNKIDLLKKKKEGDFKSELLKTGLILDENGGEVLLCFSSFKKNIGIKNIIDNINLLSYMNFKEENIKYYFGYILESYYFKYSSFLIKGILKNGFLSIGDKLLLTKSKEEIVINKLFNYFNKPITKTNCNEPFLFYGHSALVGEKFIVNNKKKFVNKKNFHDKILRKRKVILFKTNCSFKLEAVKNVCKKKKIDFILKIIYLKIGVLNKSDIILSENLKCKIIYYIDYDYNNKKNINVLVFKNIYNVFSFLKKLIHKITFKVLVLRVFNIKKKNYAGCRILKGNIKVKSKVFIKRKKEKYLSKVLEITFNKKRINSIDKGDFCLLLDDFNLKEGDVLYSLDKFKINENKK